ncbi:hypothetical protein B0A52_03248 [Exophiala mesophila]|uniref:Uncharacterized protein n=1 Tax=Exophiala mesophila TaxID=212818 RepID=A0A438NAV2_EXOME|nr:hypothetical protein B0A52_03248 [Exophiala mesophila]
MSPRPATEENTMTGSSGSPNFFESVDPAGFPANDKEKARPWMALLASRQDASRKPGAVDKMLVVCSLQHDHGTSSLGGY